MSVYDSLVIIEFQWRRDIKHWPFFLYDDRNGENQMTRIDEWIEPNSSTKLHSSHSHLECFTLRIRVCE